MVYNFCSPPSTCVGTDTDEEEPQAASFEFRLSTLPVWAQKVAMSRPSMAEQLERGSGHKKTPSDLAPPKKAEGKWAEVQSCCCCCCHCHYRCSNGLLLESDRIRNEVCIGCEHF